MQNQSKHTPRGCKIKTNSNIEGVVGVSIWHFMESWTQRIDKREQIQIIPNIGGVN